MTAIARAALPGTVTLAWDPNSESNLEGYKLYIGTESRQYDIVIPVGLVTTYTLTELPPGSKFYFALTAYNSLGMESDFSEEVSLSSQAELAAQQTATGFQLTVLGDSLATYQIEVSDNLRDWKTLTTQNSDVLGKVSVVEARNTQSSRRFYRAIKLN